ncbi:hypothetical protein V1511DRAFT_520381 [Dipodascopsis uninucleata]
MSSANKDPVVYLRSLKAVRERSRLVLEKAKANELTNFDVDLSKFDATVEYVANIIKRDFGSDYGVIPPHGRWQHFNVGGVKRVEELVASWKDVESIEVARRLVDLFVVSVLLDAGAGNSWTFKEPGRDSASYGRSEGLAVASLYMFVNGLLSSDARFPHQVDASALKHLRYDVVESALQSSPQNLLEGVAGRAELLRKLGDALDSNKKFFGNSGRPGNMVDYLLKMSSTGTLSKEPTLVSVLSVWEVVMDGFAPIWPKSRTVLNGVSLGDAWPCSSMPQDGEEWEKIVPFHKLSQWLCYSILTPMEKYGNIKFTEANMQTGLPEYRNGGLFIDTGVLILKPSVFERGISNYSKFDLPSRSDVPIFSPDEDVIVEWRALTVNFLDMLLPAVNKFLGIEGTNKELVLPQLLEAGSWKGGREIAAEKRPDTKGCDDYSSTTMYKSSNSRNSTANRRLMTEYMQLMNEAPDGISAGPVDEDNLFEWECLLQGPEDTPFEGGVFPATLTFPKDYPLNPPTMKFTCEMFHPNGNKYMSANADGTVCISILHAPGDDPNMYELASERWSPIQSVEKILISVMSMLAEPNDESGANIDACKVWRNDREEYNRIVRANVRKTLGL